MDDLADLVHRNDLQHLDLAGFGVDCTSTKCAANE
jgi:hypothetical protein